MLIVEYKTKIQHCLSHKMFKILYRWGNNRYVYKKKKKLFFVSLETGLQTTQLISKEMNCHWTPTGLTYICSSCAPTRSFLPQLWRCHWLCTTALAAAPPAWPGIQHTLLNHHRKQVMHVLLIASIFPSEHFCETTCAQVCKYGHQIKCKKASPLEDLAFECGRVSISPRSYPLHHRERNQWQEERTISSRRDSLLLSVAHIYPDFSLSALTHFQLHKIWDLPVHFKSLK